MTPINLFVKYTNIYVVDPKPFYSNLLLAILSAVLLTLSFPEYDIEILAWIGLIPLLLLIRRNSLKDAFLWCWVSGILFFLFTIYWLIMTINNYGDVPAWISALYTMLDILHVFVHLMPGNALFSVRLPLAQHQFIWPSPLIYSKLLNKTHWYPSGSCHMLWQKHSRGYITSVIRRGQITIGLSKVVSRSLRGVILTSLKRNTAT